MKKKILKVKGKYFRSIKVKGKDMKVRYFGSGIK